MANILKYDPKITPTILLWMSRSGLSDKEMAAELKIHKRTLDGWKNKYPAVKQALRAGKDWFDASAEQKLFQTTMGYKTTDVSINYKYYYNKKTGEAIIDPDTGKTMKKPVGETHVTKEIPPNITSLIFWLKNRQPERWNDVQRVDLKADLKTINAFQIVDKDGNEISPEITTTNN
jgi:hypothetical protein